MALFGMKIKRRSVPNIGGFHAAYLDVKTSNSVYKREPMGFSRAFFSALSLTFGLMMCYVALHYIPAFLNPKKILHISGAANYESPARLKKRNPLQKLLGPYVDAFDTQRTYLREGQIIQAQYYLPEGVKLDLEILRCQRAWIVEIFTCNPLSREHSQSVRQLGSETFKFKEEGFYHFRHTITPPIDRTGEYRVVWSRRY